MLAPIHRWHVGLIHRPGRSEMVFLHNSSHTGTQIIDSTGWPVGPDIRTEAQYLDEIYAGVLAFMERRA